METQSAPALFSFEESALEAEVKKAYQAGYPKEVILKTKKIVLRRLKDKNLPPVRNLPSYFQNLLVKVLWSEKETSKNRESFRKIKNKLLLQSIKKEMEEAGYSEAEITEKIRKELGLYFSLADKN